MTLWRTAGAKAHEFGLGVPMRLVARVRRNILTRCGQRGIISNRAEAARDPSPAPADQALILGQRAQQCRLGRRRDGGQSAPERVFGGICSDPPVLAGGLGRARRDAGAASAARSARPSGVARGVGTRAGEIAGPHRSRRPGKMRQSHMAQSPGDGPALAERVRVWMTRTARIRRNSAVGGFRSVPDRAWNDAFAPN